MKGSYLNDPCRELRDGEPDEDESMATLRDEIEHWKRGVANRDAALRLCGEARDRYAAEADRLRDENRQRGQERDAARAEARTTKLDLERLLGDASDSIEAVIRERDAGRIKISALLDAAERLLEHFSDGLPDHMVEEFRDAVVAARRP